MRTEFRPLSEDDREQILRVRRIAFGRTGERIGRETLDWRLPHSQGAFLEGRLVSMSFMYPLHAYVGGRRLTYGGLSGVATAPEARRRGVVADGLRRWFERLREQGIGWSGEHPFDPTFYARLGYQTVPNGHSVELPVARLRAATGTRAGRTAGLDAAPVEADGLGALAAVYASFGPRFSFTHARDDGVKDHWGWTLRRPWEDDAQFAYALEDAYVVFSLQEPAGEGEPLLAVRDMAYASPAGRDRLLAFLCSFEGQAGSVRLHLPPGDPVALDWGAWHTVSSPEFQVRVVDLAAVLRDLSWPVPARLTLQLSDPDCAWNDGTFELELGPEGGTARRAGASEPDAALGIGALAALLTRAAPPASLLADGRATGSLAALTALASPLAGHPVFKPHNDHF